jgi:hypothetical protein
MHTTIDSARIQQVIQWFHPVAGIERDYSWNRANILEMTDLLLTADAVAIATSAVPSQNTPKDSHHYFTSRAFDKGLVSVQARNETSAAQAADEVTSWVNNGQAGIAELRAAILNLQATHEFKCWISWAREATWDGDSQRIGGLFDLTWGDALAKALEIEPERLIRIHAQSKDVDRARRLILNSYSDALVLERAFVGAALLRGRFHDAIARLNAHSHVHHVFRSEILGAKPYDAVFSRPSETAVVLGSMIISLADQESDTHSRIDRWLDSIRRCRSYLATGDIKLSAEPAADGAVGAAFAILKGAEVDCAPEAERNLARLVDSVGIGVVAAVVAQFLGVTEPIHPAAITMGVAQWIYGERRGVVERAISLQYGNRRRLSDLAGRILWNKSANAVK